MALELLSELKNKASLNNLFEHIFVIFFKGSTILAYNNNKM